MPARKRRPWTRWDARRLRKLRTLVLSGLNDREVAERMGANRNLVQIQRRRFGLPAIGHRSAGSKAKRSASLRRAKQGEHTEIARIQAAHAGWPGAAGPGQAAVLDLLERTPRTARQVGAALDVRHDTACVHLRRLKAAGFVAATIRHAEGAASSRRWERVWALAPGVRRHRTDAGHRDPTVRPVTEAGRKSVEEALKQ